MEINIKKFSGISTMPNDVNVVILFIRIKNSGRTGIGLQLSVSKIGVKVGGVKEKTYGR